MTNITPYEVIGGEAAIRTLVEKFYYFMDTLPEAKGIRDMHQADLTSAESKLIKYMTGWLGGPNLYIEEYGHPILRARHLPLQLVNQNVISGCFV